MENKNESFESILENSPGFRNPHCIDYLTAQVGLDNNTFYTNMSGLRGRFPQEEYGSELRQVQASKWAFRYDHCTKLFSHNIILLFQVGCRRH